MTQLSHTLTQSVQRVFLFAQLLRRCFTLARSAARLQTLENEVLHTYSTFQRHKHLTLTREACVRFTARTYTYLRFIAHRIATISHPRTEFENGAKGSLCQAHSPFFLRV